MQRERKPFHIPFKLQKLNHDSVSVIVSHATLFEQFNQNKSCAYLRQDFVIPATNVTVFVLSFSEVEALLLPPVFEPMSHYGIGSHGSESCEHIRDCVHEFCRVSKTLSVDDNATLGRLAEVVKARLEQKSRECLRCLQGQAVMYSYSCDATSFLCSSFAGSSSSGVKIMRQGRVLH